MLTPDFPLLEQILPAAGEGAAHGWRWAAISRAKEDSRCPPGANDDMWRVRVVSGQLWAAICDVATHKRGISGADIHAIIDTALYGASEYASPTEIIVEAHSLLTAELASRQAAGVACLFLLMLTAQGECRFAHVGDSVALRWQPQNWWRRSRLSLVNSRHRRGHGLTQSVGARAPGGPRIEEGVFFARPGERILLATDGVFHDAMTLPRMKSWVDAHERRSDQCLPFDLVRKVEAEARFGQPQADDSTLLLLERAPNS